MVLDRQRSGHVEPVGAVAVQRHVDGAEAAVAVAREFQWHTRRRIDHRAVARGGVTAGEGERTQRNRPEIILRAGPIGAIVERPRLAARAADELVEAQQPLSRPGARKSVGSGKVEDVRYET